jgi:phosphate transport system permease protein
MARRGAHRADQLFAGLTFAFALGVTLLVLAILVALVLAARPALGTFGWRFLIGTAWDPVEQRFGALPFLFGTLVSSAIALALAGPIGLGVAIFLSELAPRGLRPALTFFIDLLAAIPSVVYGLWGIFVLAPFVRAYPGAWLARNLGFLPIFRGPSYGVGMLSGGLILSIMILPTISSIAREVLRAVPDAQREGALALGATRWEMVAQAVLPYARSGIVGALVLGLGRALGETMAVTMVIGNRPEISASLLAPSYTMASVLANEFTEATTDLYVATLIEIGLLLFGVTIAVNIVARLLVRRGGR